MKYAIANNCLLEHAQKRLSAPTVVPGYPTMVSTRFILRSTRVHVLVTWTRYSIADHMHLVKYTNGSARETRRPRHPDIPDTATRSHKHLLNVLGRHATSQLTEVRYTRSLSTVPQPPWGSTARVHDNTHSTQGELVLDLRRILPLLLHPAKLPTAQA